MPSFTHTVTVQATSTALWALVADPQRVAALFRFMDVEACEQTSGGRATFWRKLTIPNMGELRWQEETCPVEAEGTLRFRAVAGDLDTFDGHWLVAPAGDGAQLTLALEYALPAHLAPNLPAPLVGYVMGEVLKTICGRIKEAAEGVPA